MSRIPSNAFGLTAVAALVLQSCQDAARPLSPGTMMSVASAEPAPLVPRIIAPQTTDSDVDWIPACRPEFNQYLSTAVDVRMARDRFCNTCSRVYDRRNVRRVA